MRKDFIPGAVTVPVWGRLLAVSPCFSEYTGARPLLFSRGGVPRSGSLAAFGGEQPVILTTAAFV